MCENSIYDLSYGSKRKHVRHDPCTFGVTFRIGLRSHCDVTHWKSLSSTIHIRGRRGSGELAVLAGTSELGGCSPLYFAAEL